MNAVNTAQIADAMRSLLLMLRDFFLLLQFVQYFLDGFIVLLIVSLPSGYVFDTLNQHGTFIVSQIERLEDG
jgi:hypothetical protein